MKLDKLLAFAFAVCFALILAYAALREAPITDPGKFFILRVLAALVAAGFGATLPGVLIVHMHIAKALAIRGTGALAAFAIVFLINPPQLLQPNTIVVGRLGDRDHAVQMPIVEALQRDATDEALKLAYEAIDLYPESSRAHYNLAVALVRKAPNDATAADSSIKAAAESLRDSLRYDVLQVLLVDEKIADPVGFVLADPDLTRLFEVFPSLRFLVSGYKKEFATAQGTSSYGHGGCLAAGTPILMADGSTRPIESLLPGDIVLSRSPEGDLETARVTSRGSARNRVLTINEAVQISTAQLLRSADGAWHSAVDVQCGSWLQMIDGGHTFVARIEASRAAYPVYWIDVSPHHVYFANGFEVHNKIMPAEQ